MKIGLFERSDGQFYEHGKYVRLTSLMGRANMPDSVHTASTGLYAVTKKRVHQSGPIMDYFSFFLG